MSQAWYDWFLQCGDNAEDPYFLPQNADTMTGGPDCEVVFKKGEAYARDSDGIVFARATRKGGLYVAHLQLRNPKHQDFRRQEWVATAAHP